MGGEDCENFRLYGCVSWIAGLHFVRSRPGARGGRGSGATGAGKRFPPPVVDNRYTASGPIVVENQVDVSAQREGVVSQILVDAGTRVHKGDLLAKLDDRQIVADLEAARAKTASTEADLNNWKAEAKVLEADFQRAKKMWEAKLIPEEQFEHARYKAEGDQWDVKRVEQLLLNAQDTQRSLELELEKTQIRAPFDGIVARRYIRAGQTVVRGDRLMWVTATGPSARAIYPAFEIRESDQGWAVGRGHRGGFQSYAGTRGAHRAGKSGGRSRQRHDRSAGRVDRLGGRSAARHAG